ncbi:hypothetical protein H6G00_01995 [Leptolyngbya sp. FACHB-541]|uniref:hypothetical protein n=1 Tax=Leptolyngbya sp. FACHB-541 TaxID=2692810 RepID=UPI001686A802|nr:hypothetical protein [Leptolyngbya sp. FACHB-541]MBD1995404.1 hypothetical protein [Leptolyngbya sp. FACHB-541]
MIATDLDRSTTSFTPKELKQRLTRMLKIIFERAYGDITAVLAVEAEAEDHIEGLFRDGKKLIEFLIKGDKITYKIATRSDRLDSWVADHIRTEHPNLPRKTGSAEYLVAYLDGRTRTDSAARKQPAKCVDGLSCGLSCIDPNETCNLKPSAIASPKELRAVRQTAKNLSLAMGSKVGGRSKKPVVDPEFEGKTIRELQRIASERNVYRSHHMSSEELQRVLTELKRDPDQQERLRKTLEKQRLTKKAYKGATGDFGKIWEQLERVTKAANTSPQAAAIFAATLLAGVAVGQYTKMRDNYKTELAESAQMAMQRAKEIPIENTDKPNIMFAVGGFSSIGSSGQAIKDQLAPKDKSPGEQWFQLQNFIIPFNHREFDIPAPEASKHNEDGSYNPFYLGHVAVNTFGSYMQNLFKGRNEAAVDLASEMYAYGARYKDSALNVLGHGAGGNVVREAAEILQRMKPNDDGINGSEIVKRLNIVNLGTPFFGFTDDKFWNNVNNKTITSSQDPFSFLPKKLPQWISTVPGHEIGDYLNNNEVRERLLETYNYFDSSLRGLAGRAAQDKKTRSAIGEVLSAVAPAPFAAIYNQLGRIKDAAQKNPEAAALLGVALTAQTSKVAYNYMSDRYRNNLGEAAKDAGREADAIQGTVPNVKKPNVMFVVGGTDAPSAEISQKLIKASNAAGNDPGWIDGKNQIVNFDPEGREDTPKDLPLGDVGKTAYTVVKGFGGMVSSTLQAGKNNDAIRLAAQMYAYGDKEMSSGGTRAYAPINVVGYDTGGLVAREAIDILRRMKPNGSLVAQRVQLATLGTPGFGLASQDMKEINLMGDSDAVSGLPFFQRGEGKTVSAAGVNGHSIDDYLASTDVMQSMTKAFQGNARTRRVTKKGSTRKPSKNKSAAPAQAASTSPKQPNISVPPRNPGDSHDPRNIANWNSLSNSRQGELLLKYKEHLDRKAARQKKASQMAQAYQQSQAPAPAPTPTPAPTPPAQPPAPQKTRPKKKNASSQQKPPGKP